MLSATFIDFADLQQMNTGSAYKYENIKDINEQVHMNCVEQRRKHEIFTMDDMKSKSEHYISHHVWDCGRGRFVTLGNLEKEMNRLK